jgi:hypothetical protein
MNNFLSSSWFRTTIRNSATHSHDTLLSRNFYYYGNLTILEVFRSTTVPCACVLL